MIRALIAAPLIFFAMKPTQSAEIGVVDTQDSHVIYIKGEILRGDADRFSTALNTAIRKASSDKHAIFTDLNSLGGSVAEASQIASLVKEKELPVSVLKSSECASACFIIFLATPYKFAWHGARIGVHSVSIENGTENASTKEITVDFARYAKESGAPDSVVGKLVGTKPNDIMFLSDAELRSMNVIFLDDEIDRSQKVSPAPSNHVSSPQTSPQSNFYSVTPNPNVDAADEQRKADFIAEQERNFVKYWNQIIGWSKAQHSGRIAAEKRCNQESCAVVVAYFDRSQRYVEAWRYNDTANGLGKKLVCRQNQYRGQLTCTDWFDGHEFAINYTHQIGANLVTQDDDIFDIFK
jgi:hypothetical protein